MSSKTVAIELSPCQTRALADLMGDTSCNKTYDSEWLFCIHSCGASSVQPRDFKGSQRIIVMYGHKGIENAFYCKVQVFF